MCVPHLEALGIVVTRFERGILHDFNLTINVPDDYQKQFGYANVAPQKGKFVEGFIFEIPFSAIAILDDYEICPEQYLRKELDIQTTSGLQNCLVYVGNPDYVSNQNHQLPQEQKDRIKWALPYLSADYATMLMLNFLSEK